MAENKPNDIIRNHERVRDFLEYNPRNGEFSWLKNSPNTVQGNRAGNKHNAGYWEVTVKQERYLAHRLAWFFIYGELPSKDIDHMNGNRMDNRIDNLRLATSSQNLANSKISSANTSGFKGVSLDKRRGTWAAYIKKNYKRRYLGNFKTPSEAHEAYKKAAVELHGEFARMS